MQKKSPELVFGVSVLGYRRNVAVQHDCVEEDLLPL